MFIVIMAHWKSSVYYSERTARDVAEARSSAYPAEGAAVIWRVRPGERRLFVDRYERGVIGAPRLHEPRDPPAPAS